MSQATTSADPQSSGRAAGMPNDRRQYRHPPIQEALCEFTVVPAAEWAIDTPSRLHEALKVRYDGPVRQELATGLQISPAGSGVVMPQPQNRIRFFNSDESRLVTITATSLTVHVLSPYGGWEEFRPAIEEALDAYADVVPVQGITEIEVRYINRIEVAAEQFRLGQYFSTPPMLPEALDVGITDFMVRVEAAYEEPSCKLVEIFASTDSPEGSAAVILDLNAVRSWDAEPLPAAQAMGHVEDLRSKEREAFEVLITEEARDMFDAGD